MRPRIYILDVLRGLLALSIMVYHYTIWTHFPWPTAIAKVINKFGYFGVIWFFVISGFSLAYSYEKKDLHTGNKLTKFYLKRFFRIAPLFTLASLITVLTGQTNWNTVQFVNNAFLTFPLYDFNSYIPTGGWSIGVEILFYMIFPALVFLLAKLGDRIFFRSVIAISLVFLSLSFEASVIKQGTLIFTPYYLMFFVSGMVIANFIVQKSIPMELSKKKYLYVSTFLIVCFLYNWPRSDDTLHHPYIGDVYHDFIYNVFHDFLIIFSTYAVIRGLENTWLSKSRILRILGDCSYSIYLLHPVVYYLWGLVTDRILYAALLSIPSTFIASYFIYNYFELYIVKKAR